MLRMYKALVRPYHEYCVHSSVLEPSVRIWELVNNLNIEGVQRRFTRMIDELGLLPYSDRLEFRKLTNLIGSCIQDTLSSRARLA